MWCRDLCLGFQDRKISLIFPNNACNFACNFIHLDGKKKLSYTLIQYLFEEEEHEVVVTKPRVNSKRDAPFQRLLPSKRDKLKNSIRIPKCRPRDFLDEVCCFSGDAINVRSLKELPRGPSDLYNARHAAKKVTLSDPHLLSNQGTAGENSSDAMWMLLQKAKRDESIAKLSIFIRECRVHPDVLVALASDRQLEELVQFCTDPQEFSIFCVDPTFNIFENNISLTVATYRNLKLENRATNQPPSLANAST